MGGTTGELDTNGGSNSLFSVLVGNGLVSAVFVSLFFCTHVGCVNKILHILLRKKMKPGLTVVIVIRFWSSCANKHKFTRKAGSVVSCVLSKKRQMVSVFYIYIETE